MPYQCENSSCELNGEVISEKIAHRRDFRCESCGTALSMIANVEGRVELAGGGNADLHALLGRLPTVLAVPLTEFLDETAPVLQLWDICNIAELSLRMLVLIGIAEHGKQLPNALARELADRIERPTFGSWLGMAQAVAKHLPTNPLIPELTESVEKFAQILGNQASLPESGCLSLRNLLAHGGGMRRGLAEHYLSKWAPRAVEIVECLSWLMDCQIVGQDRQGKLRVLRGPHPQGEIVGEEMSGKFPGDSADSLWLVRSNRTLVLWPLGRYTTPGMAEQAMESTECVAQIYSRRGEVRLQYVNCGGDGAVSDSDLTALDSYLALFKVEAPPSVFSEYSVRGFESEFRQEASRRIGREHELDMLRTAVNEMQGGLLWLGGVAGMGKSCLIASLTEELLENPPKGILVLAYRFRASDDRCSRETFVRFAVERLETWDGLTPRKSELPETTKPLDRLKECLTRITDDRRVRFIVDGLDEISERDRQFVQEVILAGATKRSGCICVGRPDYGIPEILRKAGASEPFPDGLPPMAQEDVRAMLVARTEGQLRKRLIKRDKESGDKIINPFIERVTKLSEGLPLYVNYVVGDVLSGKIAPEAEGQLPAGLHAYHEELLRRCAIGDLQAVVTPVVATLAVAYEPLTCKGLASLLARRGVMRDPDVALVGRALLALASMIRRAPNADGEEGYTLFHASLREHILQSDGMRHTVGMARTALAEAAHKPAGDTAEKYLYRCGIRHLLDEGKREDSLHLLTDFNYVMARLQKLGGAKGAVADYYRDWDAVKYATPIVGDAEVWWDFMSLNRHLLMCGDATWGAHKILFQLAFEHADDSPITRAAEAFLAAGKCDWLWLRRVNRPKIWSRSPCLEILYGSFARQLSDGRILCFPGNNTLRIWDRRDRCYVSLLQGHSGFISDGIELSDSRILSWSHNDRTLRVWDRASGECLSVLRGHSDGVEGARELSDGHVLSWASDGTLRAWDRNTGECTALFLGHSVGKFHFIGGCGAEELSDGRILSWTGDDKALRIWERATGQCVRVLHPQSGSVTRGMGLSDGRILSWDFRGTLSIWDSVTGQCTALLQGHSMKINGALELSDDHLLSWSNDGTLRTWDRTTGRCVTVLEGHSLGRIGFFGVSGAVELFDGRILSWAGDSTLRTWDKSSGVCRSVLEGHTAPVLGGLQLRDRRILSWSEDGTIRIWDEAAPKCLSVLEGHTEKVLTVMELSDGHILSSSSDGTLRIWRTISTNCPLPPRHLAKIRGVSELSNGCFLSWADMDNTLFVWDGFSGDLVRVLQGHTYDVGGGLELSEGRILSWSLADDTMRVWDGSSGECLSVLHAEELSKALDSLRRGRDITQRIHSETIPEEANFVEGHTSGVKGALRLTDGRVLVWCTDKVLRVWSKDCVNCISILMGHTIDVEGAIELLDGRVLSWDNCTLRIWDAASGRCLSVVQGCVGWSSQVLALSGGRFLSWSFGKDTTLRILDQASGGCVYVLKGHAGCVNVGAMELSDGHVLTWSWEPQRGNILHLWDTSTGALLLSYSISEVRSRDRDLWWEFIRREGSSFGDWGAVRNGLFHCSGIRVSCVISGKLNDFHPHVLKPSGLLAVSSGAVLAFFRLMFGARPVTLVEASKLVQDCNGARL